MDYISQLNGFRSPTRGVGGVVFVCVSAQVFLFTGGLWPQFPCVATKEGLNKNFKKGRKVEMDGKTDIKREALTEELNYLT